MIILVIAKFPIQKKTGHMIQFRSNVSLSFQVSQKLDLFGNRSYYLSAYRFGLIVFLINVVCSVKSKNLEFDTKDASLKIFKRPSL